MSIAAPRKPQAWHKSSKLAQIKIDHEEVLHLDPAQLPADSEFKGCEDSLVQGVLIHTAVYRLLHDS